MIMNRKQISYLFGRGAIGFDMAFLATAIKFGNNAVNDFSNSQVAPGIVSGLLSLYAAYHGLKENMIRGLSYYELKKITNNKESFPLEHSDKIIIDDAKGLELLLSETNSSKKNEWGTFVKAYDDNETAIVYNILNFSLGKDIGLINEGKRGSLTMESEKAIEQGYNGSQHYHPDIGPKWFGARNFYIGALDKFKQKGWIQLLTFNLPEGPEIIGYNRQYVYLPTDSFKRELKRATPNQIMKYLHI